MDRINRTGWKQTFWKEPTGHHRPTAVGQQCPHWVAFSKLYSTQSLMLELSQELLGQTTKGLSWDAVEDQMAAKPSPPHTAFLSPVDRILGVSQRQPRALPKAPAVHRAGGEEHGIRVP